MNNFIKTFRGKRPLFGSSVYIAESAVIIGDVKIGNDSSIWPSVVIRGDINSIRIGSNTSVQDGSVLHITHKSTYNPSGYPLKIGSDVTIGHNAVLHGCTIGNRCLIGIGAIVMDGSIIEDEVMVAAGCLVPPGKHLMTGHLFKGSPAKMARPLTEEEKLYLRYNAANYVKLKDEYLSQK
ncbi:MAG: gamma carbonic anhydrase family protein [Candidatus Endonucleobacter sp. (ex Gigantidas childressi)]|nr:gamma carbonic anhydrase family protein [Candidatus Endonucleobacter sp. (ex Gigantidas childressi)]